MNTISTAILCLWLGGLSWAAKAQSRAEIDRHRVVQAPEPKPVVAEARRNKNEVELAFSGLFLAYKGFVSSQDNNVCSFTPSCSEYGLLAVRQHGVMMGGIRTMDRLMRCNGLSPHKYAIDRKRRLLIDNP